MGPCRRRAARGRRRRRRGRVGEPCESVTSDQPTSPSSVVALTKSQGRQPASQASVSSEASFTRHAGYAPLSPFEAPRPRGSGVHVASCSPVSRARSAEAPVLTAKRARPQRGPPGGTVRRSKWRTMGAVLVEGRSNEDGAPCRDGCETADRDAGTRGGIGKEKPRPGLSGAGARAHPTRQRVGRAGDRRAPGQASSPTVDPGRWRQRPRAVDGPRRLRARRGAARGHRPSATASMNPRSSWRRSTEEQVPIPVAVDHVQGGVLRMRSHHVPTSVGVIEDGRRPVEADGSDEVVARGVRRDLTRQRHDLWVVVAAVNPKPIAAAELAVSPTRVAGERTGAQSRASAVERRPTPIRLQKPDDRGDSIAHGCEVVVVIEVEVP